MFIKPAIKGQGSINAGISLLKEYDIFVAPDRDWETKFLNLE